MRRCHTMSHVSRRGGQPVRSLKTQKPWTGPWTVRCRMILRGCHNSKSSHVMFQNRAKAERVAERNPKSLSCFISFIGFTSFAFTEFSCVFLVFFTVFSYVPQFSYVFLCFPGISRSLFTFAYLFPALEWQDYAPLILENGLDPGCGHLTKGTWLGGAGPGTGLCHKNTAGWLVVWNIYFSSYKLVIIPLTIGISPINYIVKLDLFSIIYIYENFIIPTDELHHFSKG